MSGEQMKIPTSREIERIIELHNLPENIRRHCRKVAEVGRFLAERLRESGEDVNVELVEAACLLHDIAKHFEAEEIGHADRGYEILKNDFPALALIIKKHALDEILKPDGLKTWEEKLTYYADKRAQYRVVSLDERLRYIENRYSAVYPNLKEKMKEIHLLLKALEKEIFIRIGLKPEELEDKLGDNKV